MSAEKENIVLFPFMAKGHIIPFLALALKLEEEKGYEITIVNTPLNIKSLKGSLPRDSSIRLLEIPFDSTQHGLPPNSESTETLPLQLMLKFIESSSSLKPAFRKLIKTLVSDEELGKKKMKKKPLCIISDMFFAWSAEVAHEFGMFHAVFNAGGGYGMAVFHTAWLNLPHLSSKTGDFQLPRFPPGYRFQTKNLPEHLRFSTGNWNFLLNMFQDWGKTDAMLFNTVEEIDQTGLSYFRGNFPSSVYPIGPIISPSRGKKESEEILNTCMDWLESKPPNSVLYIAFGSQSSPSETQMIELAKALETSNVNFLWAIRPPSSFISDSNHEEKQWLPEGFEERIQSNKKGLLIKKWAPQMGILSHKAIGAFLTHCGWNSIVEALSNGVPMLSWPMGAEQPFNAQMLKDELRVCVAVANGNSSQVRHEEIAEKIELVMKKADGNAMRRKACKIMEMIFNATYVDKKGVIKGSSVKALDDFITAALEKREN